MQDRGLRKMEEEWVNYFEVENESLQKSIFVCREELIEAWNGFKTFSKDCALDKPLNLEKDKPKFKGPGLSKKKVQVLTMKRTCGMPYWDLSKVNECHHYSDMSMMI